MPLTSSATSEAAPVAWSVMVATLSARAPGEPPAEAPAPPQPTRLRDPVWFEPYPDTLLESMVDRSPQPGSRYETRDAIGLAFVVALQRLPPRQRAVLVLRDMLAFRAREVAEMTVPAGGALERFRLVPTRANGRPAFGCYLRDPRAPLGHAYGLMVLTLSGGQIAAITGFADTSVFRPFGLPRTIQA